MLESTPSRRRFIQSAIAAGVAGSLTHPLRAAEATAAGSSTLPDLPYGFDALEPVIDARTMEIHHGKHHAGYVSKLNAALEGKASLSGKPLEDLLAGLPSIDDPATQTAVRNNGGGHWNHSLFWEIMAPSEKSGAPSDDLSAALRSSFGSMEEFRKKFAEAAAGRFGSGWAWLVKRGDELMVTSTPNQDNPLMKGIVPDGETGTPLLGLDVWEHAYYLNYQNRRGDYVEAWWKVVNWNKVSENFAA